MKQNDAAKESGLHHKIIELACLNEADAKLVQEARGISAYDLASGRLSQKFLTDAVGLKSTSARLRLIAAARSHMDEERTAGATRRVPKPSREASTPSHAPKPAKMISGSQKIVACTTVAVVVIALWLAQQVRAELYISRGIELRLQRRSAEAMASYDSAIAITGSVFNVEGRSYLGKGKTLAELDRMPEAIASLEYALAAGVDSPEARHMIAAWNGDRHSSSDHGGSSIADQHKYVENLFDSYLDFNDELNSLQYRPQLLRKAVEGVLTNVYRQSSQGRTILDLGCGTGLSGQAFATIFNHQRIIGVDISQKMIEAAAATHAYDELKKMEITQMLDKIEPQSVDLVIAADVFPYVQPAELDKVLKHCARSLPSGGLLAFTIEKLDLSAEDWILLPTGRYAYAPRYISEMAEQHRYKTVVKKAVELRKDAGVMIHGVAFVLKRL